MFICILIAIIIVSILFFIFRNKIYSKKIKRAICNEEYSEADKLLFEKYLFFGHLFTTANYYDSKIEIEFRKGELLRTNFSLAYNEILNTKKTLKNRTLIYFSLKAMINNNANIAIKLINRCKNIDSDNDNKELAKLILMLASNDYKKYLESVQSFPFKDSDLEAIFSFFTLKAFESIGEKITVGNDSLPRSKYAYLRGDEQ